MNKPLNTLIVLALLLGLAFPMILHGATQEELQKRMDLLEKLDQLDQADLDATLEKAEVCILNRNFNCAREHLEETEPFVTTESQERQVARTRQRLNREIAQVQREQEQARQLAEEQRRLDREEERLEEMERQQAEWEAEQRRLAQQSSSSTNTGIDWDGVMQGVDLFMQSERIEQQHRAQQAETIRRMQQEAERGAQRQQDRIAAAQRKYEQKQRALQQQQQRATREQQQRAARQQQQRQAQIEQQRQARAQQQRQAQQRQLERIASAAANSGSSSGSTTSYGASYGSSSGSGSSSDSGSSSSSGSNSNSGFSSGSGSSSGSSPTSDASTSSADTDGPKYSGKIYEPNPVTIKGENFTWVSDRSRAVSGARLKAVNDIKEECRSRGARVDSITMSQIKDEIAPARWSYKTPDCKQGGWNDEEWACTAQVSGTCYRNQ